MKLDDRSRQQIKKWMRDFINDNCIYRIKPGEDRLPSHYNIENDPGFTCVILSRIGTLNSKFSTYLGYCFWDLFYEKYKQKPFQLTGLETASIPMMTAISVVGQTFGIEDLNCFYIRKEPKDYGLMQTFEGVIKEDMPAMVIDDFYNSRGTFLKVKQYLDDHGIEIYEDAFALINKSWELYSNNRPTENMLKMKTQMENVNIVSLFEITDFELNYTKYMLKKYEQSLD